MLLISLTIIIGNTHACWKPSVYQSTTIEQRDSANPIIKQIDMTQNSWNLVLTE